MKCFVPEISWHNRDPVYSVDFQPKRGENELFYRLASGGADCHVVIWHVTLTPEDNENKLASFECAADLQRHTKCVNCVRFSPSAEFLASGDDDGHIIIWKMRDDVDPPELPGEDSEKDKESWIPLKALRGHLQDIYDLAWSPDSKFLVSGSIDNTAILWDVDKKKNCGMLGDHKGFVQGVAWDPKGKYIATLSSDRNMRVFDTEKKRKQIARCFKGKLPAALAKAKPPAPVNGEQTPQEVEKEKLSKLFHNETLKTFFRRLTFSTCGDLLIAPCGILEDDEKNYDVSYVFTRGAYSKPALHLPSPGQYTVAARACPLLFTLRGTAPSLFAMPHRSVYAIATRNAIVLYDTQQSLPFGYVGNIHYTGITDLTWSPDGRLLIASSSEGFCSVITFEEGEIGETFVSKVPATAAADINPEIIAVPAKDNKENEIVEVDMMGIEVLELGEKMEVEIKKHKDEGVFKTPTKTAPRTPERIRESLKRNMASPNEKAEDDSMNNSQDSMVSELSLCFDGDEEDFISKEEQARRLMSPFRGSPVAASPSKRTPKISPGRTFGSPGGPMGSPITPKSGRRVNLITLSSPKTKRKL